MVPWGRLLQPEVEPDSHRNARAHLEQIGLKVTRIIRVHPDAYLYLGVPSDTAPYGEPMTAWLTWNRQTGALSFGFDVGWPAERGPLSHSIRTIYPKET